MVLVNEYIIYGALRGSTNQFYGGTGTSRSTVNGAMTLPLLRRVATGLVGNHAMPVTKMLKPTAMYGTTAVFDAFNVYVPYQLEGDCRDLPNFTPVEQYSDPSQARAQRNRQVRALPLHHPPGHRGHPGQRRQRCFHRRPVHLDLGHEHRRVPADRGGRRRLLADQPARRRLDQAGADAARGNQQGRPLGQRGYSGASQWKAVMVENPGWMAVLNVAMRAAVRSRDAEHHPTADDRSGQPG